MKSLLFAGFLFAAFDAGAVEAQTQGLQVIGFSESVRLRVDGQAVTLNAGSAGYTIPAGARATVLAGDAALFAENALLSVDAGDSFLYIADSDGPGQLLVEAGDVLITPSGKPAYTVGAGEFGPLNGMPVRTPPLQPAVPEETRPAKPSGPLAALAAGVGSLSQLKPSKLNLIVEVRPYYKLTQAYDSNIYLVAKDRPNGIITGGGVRGSWVTTNRLGSRFLFPLSRRSKLSLRYDAEFVNYGTQPDANNAVNQEVRADFGHAAARGTSWKTWMHYLNTEDPAFSELVARERRFQNTVGFEYDYARSRRFFIRPRAVHVLHKYLNPSLAAVLNRFEARVGADVGMRVRPKTRVFASYTRELIHYSAGRITHSKSHFAGLGVEGELAARLTGRVDAAMTFRRYDVPVTVGSRRFNTLTTALNLQYKPGRRFASRLSLSRALTETTFHVNRYYVANRVALGFTHFYRKLALSLDGSFQTDRYPETTTIRGVSKNRRDDLYSGSVRADYKVRPWLGMGLFYTRAQRHSVFVDQFNYVDDKTGLTLEMAF